MEATGRTSGIMLPLFSLRSETDFGVGDFGSLAGFFDWLQRAGQTLWMTLPLLPTTADGSPYSTRCAFGLNPLLIDTHALVSELNLTLSPEQVAQLKSAREQPNVRYEQVGPLKRSVMDQAFARFQAEPRPAAFTDFCAAEKEWLDDWALFDAISNEQMLRAWWEWPEPLAQRDGRALEQAKLRLEVEILRRQWEQWVAHRQWNQVRAQAKQRGVRICGDEPFIIGADSADCWCNPHLLRRDARLGAPPDDFSADGQDWGLPWFDFEAIAAEDYRWLKLRASKAASYYDLRRVDHAIGYFRQWIRDEHTPRGRFVPSDEGQARDLGDRNFRILSADAPVIAEDLGVIPRWARQVLSNLKIPGYQVMRWSREDGVYADSHRYPVISMATTGTHDTETMREWWETAPRWEKEAATRMWPELHGFDPGRGFDMETHQALLKCAENASSQLCVLPWQDVFGERERINFPGTVAPTNWSYRIKVTSEELVRRDDTARAADWLMRLSREGGRGPAQSA